MYFSVAQEVRQHVSALLSHRPGKETNPSSAADPSPPESTPPPPNTVNPPGNRTHHRPDYAAVPHEDKGKLAACHVCALLPRPGTRQRAGPGAGRKARPGAAAPPATAGTSPAGVSQREGGDAADAVAERTPRRRPKPAVEQRLRSRRPPPQGAGRGARPRARGRQASTPPRSRPRGERGRGASSCPATAERWGGRGGSPPHPAVPQPFPPDKSGAGQPQARRGRRCPAAALCEGSPPPPGITAHPHVTVVSNGLICSPARSSSIAAPPGSLGRGALNGRRTESRSCGGAAGCLAEAGGPCALGTGRPRLLRRAGG